MRPRKARLRENLQFMHEELRKGFIYYSPSPMASSDLSTTPQETTSYFQVMHKDDTTPVADHRVECGGRRALDSSNLTRPTLLK